MSRALGRWMSGGVDVGQPFLSFVLSPGVFFTDTMKTCRNAVFPSSVYTFLGRSLGLQMAVRGPRPGDGLEGGWLDLGWIEYPGGSWLSPWVRNQPPKDPIFFSSCFHESETQISVWERDFRRQSLRSEWKFATPCSPQRSHVLLWGALRGGRLAPNSRKQECYRGC